MSDRLTLALRRGLILPDAGEIAVFAPTRGDDLSALPRDRVRVIQPNRPDHDHFAERGFDCAPLPGEGYGAAVVMLPRAKAQACALIAEAAARTSGPVIVDGARTDGIDSMLRKIRARVPISGPLSKAHGKVFWFDTDTDTDAFADWLAVPTTLAGGFITAPGVFSADGIDPASALLAERLPLKLGAHVADLGAGWGYLSARILELPGLKTLDLVEADHVALDCARCNITDPRTRFHWADATRWAPPERLDAVVMNPPFHVGRAADPGVGRGFITAAAAMLKPSGSLWLVANRHLPYEQALADAFATQTELAGNTRFKVLRAQRPSRPRR